MSKGVSCIESTVSERESRSNYSSKPHACVCVFILGLFDMYHEVDV